MYTLVANSSYVRTAAKFFRVHPELRKRYEQILVALEVDQLQPRIQLHRLIGAHRETHAVRLTYAYRITLTLHITEHKIVLLDIGSYDEVYG